MILWDVGSNDDVTLLLGDCLDKMGEMASNSVDSIVTDPPYGLSFMGKKWDHSVPSVEIWEEALRVLKPGGHLLAFAGTRTQHRMAVNIEDAGFEIRDMITWNYSSGFPKSHDVSKAIDRAAGVEREVLGRTAGARNGNGTNVDYGSFGSAVDGLRDITAPATLEAKQWDGWGTSLKPSLEPITVARKPLVGTVAENVLKYGVGGINVDGCRIASSDNISNHGRKPTDNGWDPRMSGGQSAGQTKGQAIGRWPANFIHDGSDEVLGLLPGDASRFFFCAKSSKRERGEECTHPTVKPVALMRYLCRLVTPPGGIVLDPFMGSGSTGLGAVAEGFRFVGVEMSAEYLEIARKRIRRSGVEVDVGDEYEVPEVKCKVGGQMDLFD